MTPIPICIALAAGGNGVTLEFSPASGSPTLVGPMTGRPVLGDVNGDGRLDVVVACGTCCGDKPDPKSGHLVVLLNEGGGKLGWAAGSPRKIGASVRKVALGDVNGDGKLDVAAAQHDSYAIDLLLGDGQGGFEPAPGSPIVTGEGPRPHTHDVVLADVNGDARLDLLATHVNDSRVAVLLGDGKGGFARVAGPPTTTARGPYDSLVVRDLDGDGHADLAVPCIHADAIDVLSGDGDGHFTRMAGAPFKVGARPGYLVCADVDLDDAPDLLTTHDDVGLVVVLHNSSRESSGSPGSKGGEGAFTRRLGSGNSTDAAGAVGAIAAAWSSPVPTWGFAAGDVNGDGYVDLALSVWADAPPRLLLGDAEGTFGEATIGGLADCHRSDYIALGDLDGDGRLDLVTAHYHHGEIAVALQRGGRP